MPAASRDPSLPLPSVEARQHSERLRATIRREIERGHGWISFVRYMELALYAPAQGYYVAGAAKLGVDGDFVTAPEISPLFGRTLARQVAPLLDPGGRRILELGAGSGALAADMLAELLDLDCIPERYSILETSPELVERQRRTLAERHPSVRERIEWVSTLPESFDGVVVANEVLDALPVHLVAWRPDGVYERGVAWQESFVWVERPLPAGALRDMAQAIDAPAGYLSEISLLAPALVRSLGSALRKGALLLIDYGFGRREYYHPQRSRGTLMCHYRHRAHGDPFFWPGLQDITAHVDFTSIAEAGLEVGLTLLGYTTQAQFLVNNDITGQLQRHRAQTASDQLALSAGAQKLLAPSEMGELFKVIALGRGIEAPLAGFTFGEKSRLL